jgi:thiaminase/transcriptional activator TenA
MTPQFLIETDVKYPAFIRPLGRPYIRRASASQAMCEGGSRCNRGAKHAHYLVGFGRALALAAAKAPNPDRIVQFAKAAEVAVVVERALHGSFFEQFAITPETFAQTPLSPTCHHYVSYLLATAYAEPYEIVLGALLPCFWIYAEVGRHIHARAAQPNSYQAWIDTYAGEEFHDAVRAVIDATDEVAREASPALRERMHGAFTRATQLEWAFWESAYQLQAWPNSYVDRLAI